MILPPIRADCQVAETYRHAPGSLRSCPLTALPSDDDARARAEHSAGPFDLKVFPGGHFYLNAQEPAVVSALRARLHRPDCEIPVPS